MRQSPQIAKRSLILGTIALRSALEVTDHPRAVELSQQLLPWLNHVGCDDEIDPIEREELSTPLGHLSDSQKVDVNWAGEAATFFCWTLNVVEPLEAQSPADQSRLQEVLPILKPEAAEFITSVRLRKRDEIEEICRRFVLIRSMLQERRNGHEGKAGTPLSQIVRRSNLQKLEEVGLTVSEEDVKQASDCLDRMTAQERSGAVGLYFVREHAALWFFSDRTNYFG
jgi:hypothetical protein